MPHSPAARGEELYFCVKRADMEENRYFSDLWLWKGGAAKRLTSSGDVNGFWLTEAGVVFSALREKRDKERAEGEAQRRAAEVQNEVVHVRGAYQQQRLRRLYQDYRKGADEKKAPIAPQLPEKQRQKDAQRQEHDHVAREVHKGVAREIAVPGGERREKFRDGVERRQVHAPADPLPVFAAEGRQAQLLHKAAPDEEQPEHHKTVEREKRQGRGPYASLHGLRLRSGQGERHWPFTRKARSASRASGASDRESE